MAPDVEQPAAGLRLPRPLPRSGRSAGRRQRAPGLPAAPGTSATPGGATVVDALVAEVVPATVLATVADLLEPAAGTAPADTAGDADPPAGAWPDDVGGCTAADACPDPAAAVPVTGAASVMLRVRVGSRPRPPDGATDRTPAPISAASSPSPSQPRTARRRGERTGVTLRPRTAGWRPAAAPSPPGRSRWRLT